MIRWDHFFSVSQGLVSERQLIDMSQLQCDIDIDCTLRISGNTLIISLLKVLENIVWYTVDLLRFIMVALN